MMKNYVKKTVQPMKPWVKGMSVKFVSISDADLHNGSPKEGDMIAHNPNNHDDKWLVAEQYFLDNYIEALENDDA